MKRLHRWPNALAQRLRSGARAHRVLRTGQESGFSIIEVMATIAVLGILVLSMTAALANGFKFMLSSKQRAAATQIANEQLERARAIGQGDWTQLGLVSGDLAGDSSIANGTCGSQTTSMYASEPVVTAGTTASNPLWPHIKIINVGATTVTARIYVTGVTNSGGCSVTNHAFKRVTVIASWARGAAGVSNKVTLATFIAPSERPSDPDFQGTASYAGGSLVGQRTIVSPAAAGTTTIFPPQSTADGRSVGLVTTYRGAAIAALAQTDAATFTTQHSSNTSVDDDSLTTGIDKHSCAPTFCGGPPVTTPPNCTTFSGTETWTDFAGGLLNSNLITTGSSCSSVTDASDSMPYTKNTSALTSGVLMSSAIPAVGVLPAFAVDNLVSSNTWSTTSTVDRITVGAQQRMTSTASATIPSAKMLRFNVPGLINAEQGVVQLDGATFTAQSHAGEGAAIPSVISGALSFRVFDPNATIGSCSSRSGDYCIVSINPSVPGFTGVDLSFPVTVDAPTLLPVARFIMTTQIQVFSPSSTTAAAGGVTTQASMIFALPKVTTTLTIQTPLGSSIATITDTMDFGQLVTSAFYSPPGT